MKQNEASYPQERENLNFLERKQKLLKVLVLFYSSFTFPVTRYLYYFIYPSQISLTPIFISTQWTKYYSNFLRLKRLDWILNRFLNVYLEMAKTRSVHHLATGLANYSLTFLVDSVVCCGSPVLSAGKYICS